MKAKVGDKIQWLSHHLYSGTKKIPCYASGVVKEVVTDQDQYVVELEDGNAVVVSAKEVVK